MSTNRQIYIFSTGNQELPTGGNIFNHSLLSELIQKGIESRLLLLPEAWDDSYDVMEKVLRLHCKEITPRSVLIFDSLVFGYLAEILPEFQSDFLIVGLMHLPLSMHPGLDEAEIEKRIKMENKAIQCADLVIGNSPYTSEIIETTYNSAGNVEVIMPGILVTERKMSYRENPFELIIIANVLPAKGYHFLIKVLGRLLQYPWHLTCIGKYDPESAYYKYLQRMIMQLSLKDRIAFTGPLNQSKTIDRLRISDLMLLPSTLETYGMVIAEAISHGVPVVASKAGGTDYAFREGCGALLPPEDENAWLDLLFDLLSSKVGYKRMIEQVRRHSDDFDSWDQVAERMIAVVDRYHKNKFG